MSAVQKFQYIQTNHKQKKKSKNGIMSLRKENTKLHYIQKST